MVGGNAGTARAHEPFKMGRVGLEPIKCLQFCLRALHRKAAGRELVADAQLPEGHP